MTQRLSQRQMKLIYVNVDEADPECESTADWSDEEYISDCDVFDDYFEDEDSDDSDNED